MWRREYSIPPQKTHIIRVLLDPKIYPTRRRKVQKKGEKAKGDATFFQSIPQGALIDCSLTHGGRNEGEAGFLPLIALLAPFQGGWLAALGHGMVWPRWCFRIYEGGGESGEQIKR